MQFNVCDGCGANNGRAGLLISSPGVAGGKHLCANCRDTVKTGNIVAHIDLPRTLEELERSFSLVDAHSSKPALSTGKAGHNDAAQKEQPE